MKTMLSRLYLLGLVALIGTCSRQSDIFLPHDVAAALPTDHADAPADQLLIDAREYITYIRQFPADQDYRLQLPGSVGFYFPAYAWEDGAGVSIEGLITVRIVAALSPEHLMLANVSSLSDDHLLSMLGAVRIELFDGERPLHPTGNYQIEIELPVGEDVEDWQLYSVFPGTNNWVPLPTEPGVIASVKGYTGEPIDVVRFATRPERWLSVAKPVAPVPQTFTQLMVQTDQPWTANQLAVFALLPGTRSLVRLSPADAPGAFMTGSLPVDVPFSLYALGRADSGVLHFAYTEAITENDVTTVELQPLAVTLEDILGFLW